MKLDRNSMTEEEAMNVVLKGLDIAMIGDRQQMQEFIASISDPVNHEEAIINYIKANYLGGYDNITDYVIGLVAQCLALELDEVTASLFIGLATTNIKRVRLYIRKWMVEAQIFGAVLNDFVDNNLSSTDEQIKFMAREIETPIPDVNPFNVMDPHPPSVDASEPA